jgi:tetratricopeptide (TPR) repeat protein
MKHTNIQKVQTIIVMLLPLLLYIKTVMYDYALDDALMITSNKFTQEGLRGTKEIFTNDVFAGLFGKGKMLVAGGRYRPFTHFMFALEKELFGFDPHVQHFINILFFVWLSFVVFQFLNFIALKLQWPIFTWNSLPFWATILFIVHPLHTEVVANIKGRDEICSLLFSLIAVLLAWKYIDHKKTSYLVVSFLMYLLALFSKENAIMWLFIFPFLLVITSSGKFEVLRKNILPWVVLFIPALIFILIRAWVTGGFLPAQPVKELMNNPFVFASKAEELATVFYTWLIYFKLLIFPYPLTHDYYPFHIQITTFANPWAWLAIAISVASVGYFFLNWKKRPWESLGIVIFWGTFIIASNLFFNIGTFMNERFMFAPLLGFSMFIFGITQRFWSKGSGKIVLMILLTAYALWAFVRMDAWKDNYTLFSTDVKTSYNSAKVNVALAEILLQQADKTADTIKKKALADTAIFYLNRAEKIYPQYIGVFDLRGKAHFILEKYDRSLQDYLKAIQIAPERKLLYDNVYYVGLAAMAKRRYDVAKRAFQVLKSLQPDSFRHDYQLCLIYDNLGMHDSAFYFVSRVLQRDSTYAPALNKLGEMYGRVKGDLNMAEKYLLKAYTLDSTNASVLENLGVVYGLRNQPQRSVHFFLKAYRKNPNNKNVIRNLAISYRNAGKLDSANYYWTLANQQLK